KTPMTTSLSMAIGIQNLGAGLMLLPFVALTQPVILHPSANSWWALAYLVLLGSVAATPCYFYILKRLPVAVTGTSSYVNPLIAILFGCLLLKEPFQVSTLLGAFIVLSGVGIVQFLKGMQGCWQTLTGWLFSSLPFYGSMKNLSENSISENPPEKYE